MWISWNVSQETGKFHWHYGVQDWQDHLMISVTPSSWTFVHPRDMRFLEEIVGTSVCVCWMAGWLCVLLWSFTRFNFQLVWPRLVLNELWNAKPGALCLFGICCNSFTRMLLGWSFANIYQRLGCWIFELAMNCAYVCIVCACIKSEVIPHCWPRCVQLLVGQWGVWLCAYWKLAVLETLPLPFNLLCPWMPLHSGAAWRKLLGKPSKIPGDPQNRDGFLVQAIYKHAAVSPATITCFTCHIWSFKIMVCAIYGWLRNILCPLRSLLAHFGWELSMETRQKGIAFGATIKDYSKK